MLLSVLYITAFIKSVKPYGRKCFCTRLSVDFSVSKSQAKDA
jgi:hypothetical protein